MLFHGYYTDNGNGVAFDVVKVCCVVSDLNAFINSPSDSYVFVTDYDGRQFSIKKNDVTWDNGGITE